MLSSAFRHKSHLTKMILTHFTQLQNPSCQELKLAIWTRASSHFAHQNQCSSIYCASTGAGIFCALNPRIAYAPQIFYEIKRPEIVVWNSLLNISAEGDSPVMLSCFSIACASLRMTWMNLLALLFWRRVQICWTLTMAELFLGILRNSGFKRIWFCSTWLLEGCLAYVR